MKDNAVPWLIEMLEELVKRKFYGKVEVSMQGGRIVHVRQEETFKPPK